MITEIKERATKKYESETVKSIGLSKTNLQNLKNFVDAIKTSDNLLLRNANLNYRKVVDLALLFATEYVKTTLNTQK